MASELEAAIAALPAKKQRLRDSFDRLAAASPVPIPFTWADVDAHISSLQSSIAARFRLLQSHQAAARPTTAEHQHRLRGKDQDSSEEDEDGGRPNRAPWDLNAGEEGEEGRVEMAIEASPDLYDAVEEGEASPGLEPEEGEEEEEDGGRANRAPSGLNAEEEGEQGRAEMAPEWSPDQDDAVEEGEASPGLESEEEGEASPGLEPEEEEEDAEETTTRAYPGHRHGETKESSCRMPDSAGRAGEAVRWDLAAARAVRDASLLADMLYWGNKRSLRARSQFLPALLCAAEPHALVVGAVRDFLDRTEPKSDKNWENCAALLCLVPNLTAEPSAGTLERASRLAEDWREMIVGKPESCRDLGRLAVWGLLQFLVSYKITLELDAHGINHLLVDVPRNKKQSCVELCNSLGLIHTMIHTITDSVNYLVENGQQRAAINYLIENGQQLDAIKLARDLDLTDKYPPLTLMNEYVEKAKKTAREILSREGDSPESLNQAMTKQVNALILSWKAVDEYVDIAHRTGIKAEITQLLHGYAHKRQSLTGASSSSSPAWSPQERKHQEELPTPEWQQQKEQHGWQRLGEKQSRKRTREQDYHRKRKGMARAERWRRRFTELSRGGGGGSFACDAGGIGDRRGQQFSEDRGGPSPCSGPC